MANLQLHLDISSPWQAVIRIDAQNGEMAFTTEITDRNETSSPTDEDKLMSE